MLARSPPPLPAQGTRTDMKLLPLLPIAAALMLHAAQAQNAAAINGQITGQINAMYPQLDAIYKDLHAHPEIAFQEVQTAAKLAAEMRAIGFEVTEKVGKTGLVAIYKNGAGQRCWCAPNSMACRWRKNRASPTPARPTRSSTARTPWWRTAAATTSI